MSGGGSDGFEWVGYGRGIVGAYLARRRVRQQVLEAAEAELRARGVSVPRRPTSVAKIARIALLIGVSLPLTRFLFRK